MTTSSATHYESLFRALDPLGILSKKQKDVIFLNFTLCSIKAQSQILSPDETCREVYFVLEGMFRAFTDQDGKEKTTGFFNQHKFMTDMRILGTPRSSEMGLVAERNCIVLKMSILNWKHLCDIYPDFKGITGNYIIDLLVGSNDLLIRTLENSTKENIEHLKVLFPGILSVVAQKNIASYLGLTEQGMSKALIGLNGKSKKNQLKVKK